MGRKNIREERNGKLFCACCQKWLPKEKFSPNRNTYDYYCRSCKADKVSYINMKHRINKHGLLAEIRSIQEDERKVEQRKERLLRYTQETKKLT